MVANAAPLRSPLTLPSPASRRGNHATQAGREAMRWERNRARRSPRPSLRAAHDRQPDIAVRIPFHMQRRTGVLDALLADLLAGAVVDDVVRMLVDVEHDDEAAALADAPRDQAGRVERN